MDANLLIEVGLNGDVSPLVSTLSGHLELQKPDTARFYLCRTCQDARDIFRQLGMVEAESYIQKNIACNGAEGNVSLWDEANTYHYSTTNGYSSLLPYDPNQFLSWISLKPDSTSIYVMPEHVAGQKDQDGCSTEMVINHQIWLSRAQNNKYTVVWFDFRNLYSATGHRLDQAPNETPLTLATGPVYQKQFASSFSHRSALHCTTSCQAADFPVLLMLDLLKLDVSMAEAWRMKEMYLLPVQSNRAFDQATVYKTTNNRLNTLSARKLFLDKAEGLQSHAAYLKTLLPPKLVDPAEQSDFRLATEHLALRASSLLSAHRRSESEWEERLALQARAAQGRQALSMSALTYCAAVFLPLSLAASFLSMQSRAKDMGMKTYDFLGVASIFGTVAAVTFTGQRRSSRLMLRLSMYGKSDGVARQAQKAYRWIRLFFGIGWMLLVVAFLVGMFGRRSTALFGSVAIGGLLFVSFFVICVVAWIVRIRRSDGVVQKRYQVASVVE